jgi:hypothetical protein
MSNSIQQQIFEAEKEAYRNLIKDFQKSKLHKPNPPTPEAVQKAQFVDKTYHWNNAGIRPRDKRAS